MTNKLLISEQKLINLMLKDDRVIQDLVSRNITENMFSEEHEFLVRSIFKQYMTTSKTSVTRLLSRDTYRANLIGVNMGDMASKLTVYDSCSFEDAELGDVEYLVKDLINGFASRRTAVVLAQYKETLEKKGHYEAAVNLRKNLDFTSFSVSNKTSKLVSLRDPDSIKEYLNEKKEQRTNPAKLIKTGIDEIDKVMPIGPAKGTLTLFISPPGCGKTTIMLNIGINVTKAKHNVLFVTIEMPANRLIDRIASNITGIDFSKVSQPGLLSEEEFAAIEKAMTDWHKNYAGNFCMLDTGGEITISMLQREIEDRLINFKPDILVVDYLSIVKPDDQDSRHDLKLGEIAKGLRAIGARYDLGVLSAAQLGRDAIRRIRKDKDQMMGTDDVKDSQEVAADCDFIFGLFQSEDGDNKLRGQTIKSRYGRSFNKFNLYFDGSICKIGNYEIAGIGDSKFKLPDKSMLIDDQTSDFSAVNLNNDDDEEDTFNLD